MSDRYLDAQVAVLGAMLIDESVVGNVMYRTREEDFTGSYRTIYRAIRSIFLTGRPPDLTLVAAELGPQYDNLLLQIMELTPTSTSVDLHIDATLEAAQLARMRTLGESLQQSVNMDDARAIATKIYRDLGDRPTVRVVQMAQGIQDFYERQKSKPEILRWGMSKLDASVMAERGDFVVIGGYPSAGKTALSVQLAWNQAQDLKIGYFSLETKPEKLIDRAVSMAAGIDFGRIKRHQLGQDDWQICGKQASAMAERKLTIIQAGGLTVAEIQALSLSGQYDIIYIDYLQLIRPEDSRRSDYEQVSQISRGLHTMATTTGITVVALSQLSRPAKGGEQEKAPGLHSLRQSGQIEQDADAVLLLYKEAPKDPASKRCLKIAKNKEGETGGILLLAFDGRSQRFTPVEASADVVQGLVQSGKAAKAVNHIKQTSLFAEMTGPDPDNPF